MKKSKVWTRYAVIIIIIFAVIALATYGVFAFACTGKKAKPTTTTILEPFTLP